MIKIGNARFDPVRFLGETPNFVFQLRLDRFGVSLTHKNQKVEVVVLQLVALLSNRLSEFPRLLVDHPLCPRLFKRLHHARLLLKVLGKPSKDVVNQGEVRQYERDDQLR